MYRLFIYLLFIYTFSLAQNFDIELTASDPTDVTNNSATLNGNVRIINENVTLYFEIETEIFT